MPIRSWCLIIQNLLIPTALHFLPTSSGPVPRVSLTQSSPPPPPPFPPQISAQYVCTSAYFRLCTSQNSLSLAEHNCASVKVSFHWLLQFSALVVNYMIWVTRRVMALLLSFKGACLSKGRLFTVWYRYCVQSHCLVYWHWKVSVYW